MITTPAQWRLAEHFRYRTYPTGGINRRKRTQSTPICPMWHGIYSLSDHMVSKWRPIFPLAEMVLAGGSQKPQERLFARKSLYRSLLNSITWCWQALNQTWMQWSQKTTRKWRKRWRKGNCTEWPRFTKFWRCWRAARTHVLPRRISRSKQADDHRGTHFGHRRDCQTILLTLSTWWGGWIQIVRKISIATTIVCREPPKKTNSNIKCLQNPKNQPSSSRKRWG